MWLGLSVAITYGAVAVAANFVNKYAVKVLPLPNVILFIQTVTTAVLLRCLASLGVVKLPPLSAVRISRLLPLALCYCGHALLVLYSLAFLSIPMYNTLKRLTPVMVLVAKAVLERRLPEAQTALSVCAIVGGCLVAGAGDLSFSGSGYSLALLCAVLQATYILLAEREGGGHGHGSGSSGRHKEHMSSGDLLDLEGKQATAVGQPPGHATSAANGHHRAAHAFAHVDKAAGVHGMSPLNPLYQHSAQPAQTTSRRTSGSGHTTSSACPPAPGTGPLSAAELLYSICVLGAPLLAASVVLSGEGARAADALLAARDAMSGGAFAAWLAVTALTEGALTGCVLLCTQLNSALTTSIVGVLKGVVSSVLGFFFLGGVKFSGVNVAGMALNTAGGVWYAAVQYARRQR